MGFRTAVSCLSVAALLAVVAAPGCASSDESTGFQPEKDASSDGIAGSSGSSGSGGVGASGGSGGVGATGGSGGLGATGGTEGGVGGFGGSGATGGASTDGGTCQPVFCPSVGTGSPCCVTPNGPCGVDYGFGNGCEVPTGPDV